jgi:hypothetical protein
VTAVVECEDGLLHVVKRQVVALVAYHVMTDVLTTSLAGIFGTAERLVHIGGHLGDFLPDMFCAICEDGSREDEAGVTCCCVRKRVSARSCPRTSTPSSQALDGEYDR